MSVLAIANQKGGVGKTTTAVNLAASLAAGEQRTLVIDMDPQGNATSGLLAQDLRGSARASLYDVLFDEQPITRAIVRSPYEHLRFLDIVPSTHDLLGAEAEMQRLPNKEKRLKNALADVEHLYDYVLLDCPPSVNLFTLNALVAADRVIVPVQAEYFALEGLAQFVETIGHVRALNPRLDVEGALITMYDGRLKLAQQVAEEVRQFVGGRAFETMIPRNVTLAEAPGFSRPVILYDILSPGSRSYQALANELIRRREASRVKRDVEPAG